MKTKGHSHKVYYTLTVAIDTDNDTADLEKSREEADNYAQDLIGNIKWHEINPNIQMVEYEDQDIESETIIY